MSDEEAISAEPLSDLPNLQLSEIPNLRRRGNALAVVALVLPVLAGCAFFFIDEFHLALSISLGTVFVTSLLLAIDAARLGSVDLKGQRHISAVILFIGMCAMWLFGYPIAYLRRKEFGASNLVLPAVVAMLFMFGAPYIRLALIPPGLPACDSPETVRLLEKIIREMPVGSKVTKIDGHHEIRYDPKIDRREGQCVMHTVDEDVVIDYVVEWQNRAKNMFQVVIPPPELPTCMSRDTVKLLEQVIRGTPVGAKAKSIDGHRELSYDREADRRQGECIVHMDDGDLVIKFFVEWRDRNKGMFWVELVK